MPASPAAACSMPDGSAAPGAAAYTWQFTRAGDDYGPSSDSCRAATSRPPTSSPTGIIFTDKHQYLQARLSRRARVLDVPQRRQRARVGAVRVLGAVGHEGGRRRMGRAEVFRENVLEPFTIGGAVKIPAGRYDFADLQIVYTMPAGASCAPTSTSAPARTSTARRTQVILDADLERVAAISSSAPTTSSRMLRFDDARRGGRTSTWRGSASAPRSTPAPPATPSCSTTRRPTGSTSTSVCATPWRRGPISGSSTTRGWTPTGNPTHLAAR